MVNKEKLLSFPEEILDVLADYKKKTGIPATDYIRDCVCRRMIVDGLIVIKTRPIYMNGKEEKIEIMDEALKYCDGDKCEMPSILEGSC